MINSSKRIVRFTTFSLCCLVMWSCSSGSFSRYQIQGPHWQGLVWTHKVSAVSRPKLEPSRPLLLQVSSKCDETSEQHALALSDQLGLKLVVLCDVPNQPLFNQLREGDLLAYTFTKYSQTGDLSWPLLIPMQKAVSLAIDRLVETGDLQPGQPLVVIGSSKRGWAAWLAALKDSRVTGAVIYAFPFADFEWQSQAVAEAGSGSPDVLQHYVKLGLLTTSPSQRVRALWAELDPVLQDRSDSLSTLLVIGQRDPYWLHKTAPKLNESENIRIVTIDGAGHDLVEYQAAQDAVEEWLRSHFQ